MSVEDHQGNLWDTIPPPGPGTFRHHQHPRLLIPCRNSGRRPDQQLEPPAPPGPKPRGQRPDLDL